MRVPAVFWLSGKGSLRSGLSHICGKHPHFFLVVGCESYHHVHSHLIVGSAGHF